MGDGLLELADPLVDDRGSGGVPARPAARRLAQPVEEGKVGSVALHGAPDVEAQDVVGTLPDRVHLGVAEEAGDRPLLDVAVAAVDLDGVAGRGDAEAGRSELDERSTHPQARAEEPVEDQRLGGLHLDDELGQLALHEGVRHELGTERLAGLGVAEGLHEGPAGAAEAHHGDAQAGTVRQLHHAGQTAAITDPAGVARRAARREQERFGVDELDLGRSDRLRAQLVLQPPDPHPVAATVTTVAQHQEGRDASDPVGRAERLGQHHVRGTVGVGGEPLEPVQPPGVALGRGCGLERREVGAAGPLGQHLRRLARHLARREERPDLLLHLLGRELLDQADHHVAARAEGAHHPDLGLVEQVAPRRGQRRGVDPGPPGLVPEGRRAEAVLDQGPPGLLERARHDDPADVAAPAVVLLEPRRVPIRLLGPLRDRSAHQRADPLEVGCRPPQAVMAQVSAHQQLQGGIAGVPVATGGAGVALGRVPARLLLAPERQRVHWLRQVVDHAVDARDTSRALSSGLVGPPVLLAPMCRPGSSALRFSSRRCAVRAVWRSAGGGYRARP